MTLRLGARPRVTWVTVPAGGRPTALIAELQQARVTLLAVAARMNDATFRTRPAAAWTIIKVAAPLVAVDRQWLQQALAIRDGPTDVFVPFDDTRWKREHPEVRQCRWAAVLTAAQASHATVVHALAQLSPAELQRTGQHPRGADTVAAIFGRYPVHDRNHTEQLAATLR